MRGRLTRASSRRIDDEQGAIAVVVAICLILFLAIATLTVDGGQLYMQRRRVVGATDAATLAAAQWCAQKFGNSLTDALTVSGRADATAAAWDSNSATNDVKPTNALLFSSDKSGPWSTNECNGDSPSGYVMATYETQKAKGFVLNRAVHSTAIAQWGAAGGSTQVAPLMLSNGRLNNCGFEYPFTGLIKDVSQCAFFWDNGSNNPTVLGHAEWGTIDLSTWGPPYLTFDGACPGNASLNDIRTWITGGYPGSLLLRADYPTPTYVCKGTGNFGGSLDNTLRAQIGRILPFPVNDPTQQVGKANGNYFNPCTPAMVQANTCTVEKYAMIAFASLKVTALYTYQGQQQPLALAACGTPPEPLNQAANARCLVTTWEGQIPDGIIGGGDPGPPGNTYGIGLSG